MVGTKADKALNLAIGSRLIGSHDESDLAAQTAGRLAQQAGYSLDEVWETRRDWLSNHAVWCGVVDGWYNAAEAA